MFQRLQCLGDTIDVAIHEYRNAGGPLDSRDGLVFGGAGKKIRARAAVHRERGHAFAFGDARDRGRIAAGRVPARAHLERDRDAGGFHDGGQDRAHQRLVAHERGARRAVADLLRRAAEVDVDDLRAHVDVAARGVRHHPGVVARDLHHARLRFAVVIHSQARLGRIPEPHVGRDHFGSRDPGAHAPAELPERAVGHARHRRERKRRRELPGPDLHWAAVVIWLAQRTPLSAGRQTSISKPTASWPGSTMRISASARSPGPSSFDWVSPGR